jgi:hypothetical protein
VPKLHCTHWTVLHTGSFRILCITHLHLAFISDVLLVVGVRDGSGRIREGAEMDGLRRLAQKSIEVDCLSGNEEDAQRYVEQSVRQYHPEQLFNVIMQRPIMRISTTPSNTGFASQYGIRPLMNLLFMRDQTITTAQGRVLMRLQSAQRRHESVVVEAVLNKLNEPPLRGSLSRKPWRAAITSRLVT